MIHRDTSSLNIVDTLTNGSVDAVITGQPNLDKIGNILGQEITIWLAQSLQATYYNLYSTGNWVSEHPELVVQFLKSLIRAESYLLKNPDGFPGLHLRKRTSGNRARGSEYHTVR